MGCWWKVGYDSEIGWHWRSGVSRESLTRWDKPNEPKNSKLDRQSWTLHKEHGAESSGINVIGKTKEVDNRSDKTLDDYQFQDKL